LVFNLSCGVGHPAKRLSLNFYGNGHENTRSQQQPGKEPEESGQGHGEVAEELPTTAEEVVRQFVADKYLGGSHD